MIENAVRIRLASSLDNDLLAELGARTFFDTFAKDNTPEDMTAYLVSSFSPQKQAEELADPKTTFLIAEVNNLPAGYARLCLNTPPPAISGLRPIEIARFYSDKSWIGRGVGAALMSACFALSVEKGCDTLWLDVWEQNLRAIRFYRKWGFAVVGRQTFQLGSDVQNDLLMQRSVKAS